MAELDPALNFRTLTDYDVKRFFEQVILNRCRLQWLTEDITVKLTLLCVCGKTPGHIDITDR